MVEVPAPSIRAPIFVSRAARSTTSGSRAALRSTVSPRASTAAIIRSSVPVTVMRSKWTAAPRRPSRRFGFDVAVRLMDVRAQLLQPADVQVDGPGADGAAARQRDARASAAGHQRPQHQAGGAHGLHQLVRRLGRCDRAACAGARVSPSIVDLRADIHQQPLHGADVAHPRDAVQRHRLGGEQRRGQRRQRRVLRSAGGDLACERQRRL